MSSRLAERPRLVAAAHGEARGARREARCATATGLCWPAALPKTIDSAAEEISSRGERLELEHRLTDLLFAHHLLNGKDGDDAKTNLIEQIGKVVNQLTRDAHVG